MRPIDPPYTIPKIHKGKTEDRWYVYFRYYDSSTNKWRLFIRKMGVNYINTRKEKEAEVARMCAYLKMRLKEGWNPITNNTEIPESRALLEALQHELDNRLPNMRPRSQSSFKSVFNLFATWVRRKNLEYIDISYFTPVMAREYLDTQARERNNSGKTLNGTKSMLSVPFNGLVAREVISKNPFAGVARYKQQTGDRNQAFTDSERELLREHLQNTAPWLYAFTQIMYYCYIRREELYRLKVQNVSLSAGSISIPAEASKNRKAESVVIPHNLRPIMESLHLERYPPGYYLFGMGEVRGALTPAEKRVTNKNFAYNAHKRALDAVGIQDRTLYSWKHSGVCAAYKATQGDIYSIMRQLRHSDLKMTQIYLKSLGLVENTAMAGDW